jgi:sugar-specific transcriptional regulator TrmB
MLKSFAAIFDKLNLNSIESAVLFASIELGPSSASAIAKRADINRITTYEALKRLSKKGLVRIRAKQNTKVQYFEAENIQSITDALERKREEITDAIKQLEQVAPTLVSLYGGRSDKPAILFYEGKEGIKRVLLDTLEQKPSEVISFASVESLQQSYDVRFLEKYWRQRTAQRIPTRGIVPRTPQALALFTPERNQQELRKIKFISQSFYSFENEIDIYGNNVSIISLDKGNEHGVIIRSKSVAKGLRSVFELLWSVAEFR